MFFTIKRERESARAQIEERTGNLSSEIVKGQIHEK